MRRYDKVRQVATKAVVTLAYALYRLREVRSGTSVGMPCREERAEEANLCGIGEW